MKTNISSPTMWANFLNSNAELLAEELKNNGTASLPDMDELVSNPQFISTEIATILCEIQRNAGKPIDILSLFIGVMSDAQITETINILKGGNSPDVVQNIYEWNNWLRAATMFQNMDIIKVLWVEAPRIIVNDFKYDCEIYVDLFEGDKWSYTPFMANLTKSIISNVKIRFFGDKQKIAKMLDEKNVLYEEVNLNSYSYDIEWLEWHEKNTFKINANQWHYELPCLIIDLKITNLKAVISRLG